MGLRLFTGLRLLPHGGFLRRGGREVRRLLGRSASRAPHTRSIIPPRRALVTRTGATPPLRSAVISIGPRADQ